MDGTNLKLRYEIKAMDGNEKEYVHRLTENMADYWDMELNDFTELKVIDKKLLDIGILYIMGLNSVGFTSCINFHVCIDALYLTIPESLSINGVPKIPLSYLD